MNPLDFCNRSSKLIISKKFDIHTLHSYPGITELGFTGKTAPALTIAYNILSGETLWDKRISHFKRVGRLDREAQIVVDDFQYHGLDDAAYTLSEAVAALKIKRSPDNIKSKLQESLGTPFDNFITSQRLEIAKNKILTNGLTLKDIATNCGFESDTALEQTLQNLEGVNVLELQKAYRKTGVHVIDSCDIADFRR